MNITRNNSLEWLVGKSVIKIDDTLEHWLNQDHYSPEFRNGLQKLKGISIEQIMLKVLEINFDNLANLPPNVSFNQNALQKFDEAIQKLSITSDNTG